MSDDLRVWPNEVREETRGAEHCLALLQSWFRSAGHVGLDVDSPLNQIDAILTRLNSIDRIASEWSGEQFKETQQGVANTLLASLAVATAMSDERAS